jgi:hypothetical protein
MGTGDLVAALVIAGAALSLLIRTLRRTGGGCAGCSQACSRTPPAAASLVRLGRAGERR